MSAARKVIQAIKVKLMLNRLSKAKENAMREFLGLPPKISWYDECTGTMMTCVKDKFCQVMFPCCIYDRSRRLKTPTCWNSQTMKEFVGFLGGVVLTFLLFLVLVYQVGVAPRTACGACMVVGGVLTLLMAFSVGCRCLVLLMLPQFFSGTGRMMLLVYALFLAMNSPLKNINANITVMSQSSTCGQERAMNGTKDLIMAAMAPMESIIDSVQGALRKLVDFGAGLRDVYLSLKKSIQEIGSTIRNAGKFLSSMVDRCNVVIGKPYTSCRNEFRKAKDRCRDALKLFKFICEIMSVVEQVCHVVRIGELLCLIVDAIKKLLQSTFELPVEDELNKAKEMFYFDVSVNYHFNYTITQTKSYSQMKEGISREIHVSMDKFTKTIGFVKDVMIITIVFVFIKAVLYRSRWLSEDRYDNIYITFLVRDLEERRTEKCKPGILPLKYDERWCYVTSCKLSGRMVKKEIKKLGFGLMLFIISVFNAAFYLMCDWGLYSALSLIKHHYSIISAPPAPPHTKLYVDGRGPMADMYRAIVGMFDPISDSKIKVDVKSCVPKPSEPDWDVYETIAAIYFVCLLLTITEAYGLRLRHMIMGCYNPRQERRRALWLYNHILKLRGGIMDSTRRTIRKNKLGKGNQQNISIKGQLAASFPLCERLLKWFGWDVKSCIYCGAEGPPDDYNNFIHCMHPDCDAIYCLDCYADLDNECAACSQAVEGKVSDTSEEEDSSIDERQKLMAMAQKKLRHRKVAAIKADRRPSRLLANLRNEFGMPGNVNHSSRAEIGIQDWSSDEEVTLFTAAPLLQKSYNTWYRTKNQTSDGDVITNMRAGNLEIMDNSVTRNYNKNAVDENLESSEETALLTSGAPLLQSPYPAGPRNMNYTNSNVMSVTDGNLENFGNVMARISPAVDENWDSDEETLSTSEAPLLDSFYSGSSDNVRSYDSYAAGNKGLYLEKNEKLIAQNLNRNAVETTMSEDGLSMDSDCESVDDVSLCNSIDTDDLDFEYQYKKRDYPEDSDESQEEEDGIFKPSKGLDLVQDDIFTSDTNSDDFSSDSEPPSLVISRE